jgi:hypothetical protein
MRIDKVSHGLGLLFGKSAGALEALTAWVDAGATNFSGGSTIHVLAIFYSPIDPIVTIEIHTCILRSAGLFRCS